MLKISLDTVAELLGKVASNEIKADTSHDGRLTWTVRANGFVVEIFDDSGEADYVDRVTDPKGKTATFNQFMNTHGVDPIGTLTDAQREKLNAMLYGDYIWAGIQAMKKKLR